MLSETSFYKRPLPAQCVSFSSDEGKRIFSAALAEGNMDTYFLLAGQFLTQADPAFCGLATLCMILNALEVDPQRELSTSSVSPSKIGNESANESVAPGVWKGPWRCESLAGRSRCTLR